MNKKDINSFKRFLQNHGMNTMFTGFYNQFRYEDNPESVQDFLMVTPRNLVITYAFDATKIKTPQFNAKYWNDLNQSWLSFINKSEERKDFEDARISDEEKAIRKEEKKNEREQAVTKAEGVVTTDWTGLDLVSVNSGRSLSRVGIEMPSENEIRVYHNEKKNVLVFNAQVSEIIENNGFEYMEMNVDRKTNSMVLVLSKNGTFHISKYSTNISAIQNRNIIPYISRYIGLKQLDPKNYYYIRIAQRMFNHDHTAYAIIISQKFTTKERK